MKQKGLIVFLLAACGAVYFVWSSFSELPKLGMIEDTSLKEVSGKAIEVKNKPLLVNFFYTKCPNVCPFTMQDLKKLQQKLKEKGVSEKQYAIVSVTLDPEYDTAETILQYKEAFGISASNWLFLRGSEEETKKYAKQFNMVYEKSADGNVTHSTSMYIVDKTGRIRARHNMADQNKRVNVEKAAEHLLELID